MSRIKKVENKKRLGKSSTIGEKHDETHYYHIICFDLINMKHAEIKGRELTL